MAAATTNHDTTRNDRDMLAGWDRRAVIDEWFEATAELQRTYLDWLTRTVRVLIPQAPLQH